MPGLVFCPLIATPTNICFPSLDTFDDYSKTSHVGKDESKVRNKSYSCIKKKKKKMRLFVTRHPSSRALLAPSRSPSVVLVGQNRPGHGMDSTGYWWCAHPFLVPTLPPTYHSTWPVLVLVPIGQDQPPTPLLLVKPCTNPPLAVPTQSLPNESSSSSSSPPHPTSSVANQ